MLAVFYFMPTQLITNILDFDIYDGDYNPKTLVFMDKSLYMELPEKPKLEIILPGYTDIKSFPVTANTLTSINSSLLGLNDINKFSDLPDGIYTLIYSICPSDIFCKTKLYLRTISLEHKLWDILTVKTEFTKEEEKKLLLFDKLLKTAKSFAYKGDSVKAQLYYVESETLLNSIKIVC